LRQKTPACQTSGQLPKLISLPPTLFKQMSSSTGILSFINGSLPQPETNFWPVFTESCRSSATGMPGSSSNVNRSQKTGGAIIALSMQKSWPRLRTVTQMAPRKQCYNTSRQSKRPYSDGGKNYVAWSNRLFDPKVKAHVSLSSSPLCISYENFERVSALANRVSSRKIGRDSVLINPLKERT
jgi:hypothetical protein